MAKVSPAFSYPGLFRVTGSLLSLVFRIEDVWQRCNQFIETAEFLIRVSPSHSYNAGRAGLGWASGWPGRDVYAACSDYVVGFVGGNVWRIVPCVYKIYTLGHFHGLLGTFLFAVGGGMYIVKKGCVFL
jgi:hypothetical protein